jgi:hypothetical protein
MKKHYRKENDCLNCGTILEGKYCHNCGQENLQIKESFGHMMNHAISDYFHFDHQFFHTLKPLFFKPGMLTNEYMAGRRVQYLHPIKMYIFVSIVYFLIFFQSGVQVVKTSQAPNKMATVERKRIDSINIRIAKNTKLSAYQKKKLLLVSKQYGMPNIKVDELDASRNKNNGFMTPTTKDTTYEQYLINQGKAPVEERDGFFERTYNKTALTYTQKYGSRAREVFFDEFKHNVPKMMFLLLPMFALILKITFWRSKKFYVEHLIYTFHIHCFLFLFLAIIMLLQLAIPVGWVIGWISTFTTLYIIWYIYKSLKIVYHRGRFRTITKMIGMSFTYFMAFVFCLCVVMIITALTAV